MSHPSGILLVVKMGACDLPALACRPLALVLMHNDFRQITHAHVTTIITYTCFMIIEFTYGCSNVKVLDISTSVYMYAWA